MLAFSFSSILTGSGYQRCSGAANRPSVLSGDTYQYSLADDGLGYLARFFGIFFSIPDRVSYSRAVGSMVAGDRRKYAVDPVVTRGG